MSFNVGNRRCVCSLSSVVDPARRRRDKARSHRQKYILKRVSPRSCNFLRWSVRQFVTLCTPCGCQCQLVQLTSRTTQIRVLVLHPAGIQVHRDPYQGNHHVCVHALLWHQPLRLSAPILRNGAQRLLPVSLRDQGPLKGHRFQAHRAHGLILMKSCPSWRTVTSGLPTGTVLSMVEMAQDS